MSSMMYEEALNEDTRVNNLRKIFNLDRQPVIHKWRLFDSFIQRWRSTITHSLTHSCY